jgi:hypothetical protein
MNRYQARESERGWAVFDSHTDETLNDAAGHYSPSGAAAYSNLLNDLEAVGRSPAMTVSALEQGA